MNFLSLNFFDFFYPPTCVVCGRILGKWICPKCTKRLSKYKKEKYDMNSAPTIYGNAVDKLKGEKYFDSIFYLFEYKNIVRKLIIKYKFGDSSYISHFFVDEILNSKNFNALLYEYDIIISVPMDKKSERVRGYNQTTLILKYLSKSNLNSKFKKISVSTDNLIKVKKTKKQSLLSGIEREENVKNAFKLKNPEEIIGKNIIVFDDIYTTGSTINEISRLLKLNGAKKVLAFVLAKD